jgi:hypothetical protein
MAADLLGKRAVRIARKDLYVACYAHSEF